LKEIKRLTDLIPDTLQGCISFRNYAENQIKRNNDDNRRLENLLTECEQRIEVKQKCNSLQGEKNDRTEQTGNTTGTDESESRE